MNLRDWRLRFPVWSSPIILLVVMILGFGLLIPSLGFYFDDWVNLYVLKTGGNLWEYLSFDRPLSAWTFMVTYPFLGAKALNWQIFTLVIRWLGVLGMWWTLRQVWPKRENEVLWMALLFAIHPVFTQQAIALTYSQNFMTYALFFLSLGSMLYAIRNPKWLWPFTILSVLSGIIHIFTMEYFWGLELIRPVLIWIILSEESNSTKLKTTLKNWLPYFLILIVAILWRETITTQAFGLPTSPNDLSWNELSWFGALLADPIQAIIQLVERMIGDFIHIIFATWYKTLQPDLFDFQSNFSIGSWLLVIISSIGLVFYFKKYQNNQAPETNGTGFTPWTYQALLVGILIFILGTTPIWMINKNITLGMFSDRFALPAMLGASILMVGVISYFRLTFNHKVIVVAIMAGLAIGSHFRTANDYRWEWTKQQRFFWQLYWRAPEIEANTAFFSSGSVFSYTGDYPTAFAINLLYDKAAGSTELPYWFFELDSGFHRDPRPYLRGISIEDDLRNYSFSGNSLASILVNFDYNNGSCLWLLDQSHDIYTDLPDLIRTALPMSDFNRIGETSDRLPFAPIFGEEPEHTWCYYFQKAEIARRDGNWKTATALAKEADQSGFSPNNKLEWIPFIEGYAYTEKLGKAKDLTLSGFNADPQTAKAYCQLWEQFLEEKIISGPDEIFVDEVYDALRCNFYLSAVSSQ